jgi:hypothetical protein
MSQLIALKLMTNDQQILFYHHLAEELCTNYGTISPYSQLKKYLKAPYTSLKQMSQKLLPKCWFCTKEKNTKD